MGERGQKHLEQVAGFFGLDLTDAQIARIVDENSFQKRTNRKPGTEDRGAHARKGVFGDWRNVFLPRHVDAFRRSAGELLIELGYEKDGRWGP
ncbi:MAG: sulfotransferase domain-containing protein [Acidobacteria bacterium]|nr:sulfotransferase domain-containing protein [Acidobacteriota bacterium]